MKQTNSLTPALFYNDFLDWIVRLQPFHSETGRPPMSPNQFYWATRIQFGCGLRVSEALNLIKSDFDLDHRVLTIRNPKTKKGGVQYTTIMPYDIDSLRDFLELFKDNERVFPTTRSTMWKYYKETGIIAGLNLFTVKDTQKIEGAFTHMMRKSCSDLYENAGAVESLIARKLRHSRSSGTMTLRYLAKDLNAVLEFDEKHFSSLEQLIKTVKEIEN